MRKKVKVYVIDRHPAELELLFVTRKMQRHEYQACWAAERARSSGICGYGLPVIDWRSGLDTLRRHLGDADRHNQRTRWRAKQCPEALYHPVSEAYRYHIDMRESDLGASMYEISRGI